MFHNLQIQTAFIHDPARNCLIPLPETAGLPPRPLASREAGLARALDKGQMSGELLLECLAPLPIPHVDTAPLKTATEPEIIVMAPPPGMRLNDYDLEDAMGLIHFIKYQAFTLAWLTLKSTLEGLGGQVVLTEEIDPQKPLNPILDDVGLFTRDPGFIYKGTFFAPNDITLPTKEMQEIKRMASSLQNPFLEALLELATNNPVINARQGQADLVVAAFQAAGVQLARRNLPAYFEGGDIIIDQAKGIALIGKSPSGAAPWSQDQEAETQRVLQQNLEADVIPIIRVNTASGLKSLGGGDRHHIDTFMSLLPGGEMLCDPRFTDIPSIATLNEIYGDKLILIDQANPAQVPAPFIGSIPGIPTNLIAVGRTLLMPSCSDDLSAQLTRRDYKLVTNRSFGVSPAYFNMAGGGPHCVTHTMPMPR